MWFFLAILGYSALALTVTLDKFILTKSVGKPIVYTFYSTIFMFGALLLYPLAPELLSGTEWLWALVSGITFGLALWAMFVATKKGEASHINPFVGAITAIATYLTAFFILGERLSLFDNIGFLVLVIATVLLSFEKTKNNNHIHVGYLYAFLAGILFAFSHICAKYLYDINDFLPVFIWTRFTTGFFALFLLFSPAVRRIFKKRKKKVKSKYRKHALSIVAVTKILGFIGVILIQYAIAIGSVTVVNALAGFQFVAMFALIYLMSVFYPKIFKEYFTKKEFWLQLSAIVLVAVGLALFVV
ncbi:MAG: hypothetical protein GF349_03610 [Candidatus Magasanikbacteria bacterium]|nr:hypothetical protein [Candidatus Magasanikbacteria bacterium]